MKMKIRKEEIIAVLNTLTVPGEGKSLVEGDAIKNLQIFGDEIVIDLTISNPSLQARKKLEVEILKAIHAKVYAKAKITINIKVEAAAPALKNCLATSCPGLPSWRKAIPRLASYPLCGPR